MSSDHAKTMDIKRKKLGCILACALADAAVQPLHWIYNLNNFKATIGDVEEIEFWTPSANPFYCLETGKQSCYGDQTHAILISLARKKEFNLEDQKQATYKVYGPDTDYALLDQEFNLEDQKQATYKMYGPDTDYALLDQAMKTHGLPVKAGWKNKSIKFFLKKMDEGSVDTGDPNDDQIDCVAKIAPLVAMYAGHADLLTHVEDVIRMTQNNDTAVAIGLAAARMLERCLLTTDASESMLDVVKYVMKCLAASDRTRPQQLDRAVIGFLQQAIDCKNMAHKDAVLQKFANS